MITKEDSLHHGQLKSHDTARPALTPLLSILSTAGIDVNDQTVSDISDCARALSSVPIGRGPDHGLLVPGIQLLFIDAANTVGPGPAIDSCIEALERLVLVHDGGLGSMDRCAICLEDVGRAGKVAQMPCSHVYHVNIVMAVKGGTMEVFWVLVWANPKFSSPSGSQLASSGDDDSRRRCAVAVAGFPSVPPITALPCILLGVGMEMKTKSSDSAEKQGHIDFSEKKKRKGMTIEGYTIDGLSIAGHETCIILPTLNLAFDIGRCPQRAVSQQFLFISHGHMDHIGGLPMYVATRGLYRMAPPTIIVPTVIKECVEKLFEAHRAMDHSELKHNLIGLNVGEEFQLLKDLKVRAFRTYHGIPSQGYIVYSLRHKLKQEYVGLPGSEIKNLKSSGVEITDTVTMPEIAFTGDTMSDFIVDDNNIDSTYVSDIETVENARDYGHTHLSEDIQNAMSTLPPSLAGRVFTLTEEDLWLCLSEVDYPVHMGSRN
ncbi:hypothetical protein RHGRI_024196 [Rhododendron griersonianum]|uniref:RING-type domain-containing protein n=1 Tax=Rhododendron griersonianum TaxID=479676 RepID=A0AAV6JBN4_9ERIC|nr:hypothetical protein RHGRI_024196 [Rhododendron griersonianum]